MVSCATAGDRQEARVPGRWGNLSGRHHSRLRQPLPGAGRSREPWHSLRLRRRQHDCSPNAIRTAFSTCTWQCARRQHELFKNATTDRERLTILATTQFAHWGEKLRELAMVVAENVSDDKDAPTLVSWPFYAMPVGISWENCPNATLIGDAAHLMSPCAGEGVNTAMLDAKALALAISDALVDVAGKTTDSLAKTEAAIAKYEREMFARVEDPTRRSAENLDLFFKAPEMLIDHVAKIFPPLCPPPVST